MFLHYSGNTREERSASPRGRGRAYAGGAELTRAGQSLRGRDRAYAGGAELTRAGQAHAPTVRY